MAVTASYEFGWVEYTVFCGLLSVSALIGLYHGVRSGSSSVEDYMLGGKKMPFLPVAISLAASFVSGISLLGIPSETYMFGTQLYNICFAISSCYFFMVFFYLPVIYELQAKSLFEYLELRFDKTVRAFVSFLYVISVVLIVPVVIYVPALAFNQVSGLSIYILAPIICGVCIFYTSLGGLRAVVWSDAFQTGCVLLALLAVITIGVARIGGVSRLIEINNSGERLELFNMDPDPTARNTFWTTTLGSLPTWLMAFAANPSTAQRYISLPTYRLAKLSVLVMAVGIVLLKSLSTLAGLVIYARYHGCDPVLTGEVKNPDQLLPHLTMEIGRDVPGLAGLFLAGIVCTAFSTMSTMLNTIAGTIYEDFLRGKLPWSQTERSDYLTIQLVTVTLGAVTTALALFVERLGTITQVAMSILGLTNGIILYIFTFGMFFPWGNSKGLRVGVIGSSLVSLGMMMGSQYYLQTGEIQFSSKTRTVDSCLQYNVTTLGLNSTEEGYPGVGTRVHYSESVPALFRLSYLYYGMLGLLVGLALGCVASLLTGPQDPALLDPGLVIPQLRGLCGKARPPTQPTDYELLPAKEREKI